MSKNALNEIYPKHCANETIIQLLQTDIINVVNEEYSPVLVTDGTAAAPSLYFASDTNLGLYRTAADSLGISTNGVLRVTVNTSAFTSTLPFRAADGSTSLPGYSFSADTNTGMYRSASDSLGLICGGTNVLSLTSSACTIDTLNLNLNANATIFNGENLGILMNGLSGIMGFQVDSTDKMTITTAAVDIIPGLKINSGTLFSALSLSKVWSPTITAGTNVSGSVVSAGYYMRFGELVIAILQCQLSVTTTNTASACTITVPVSHSGAGTVVAAWGQGWRYAGPHSTNDGCVGPTTSDTTTVTMKFFQSSNSSNDWVVGFAYFTSQ